MKYQYGVVAAAALLLPAHAFPALAPRFLNAEKAIESRQSGPGTVQDPAVVTRQFNAQLQYVSNKGIHQFIAPGPGDARGPCPGLNAMANHGYIPHNGVATLTQFIQGTYEVFGMGLDLGGFLAVLGASIDGNGISWSIGGPSLAAIGGDGLIGSHNKYESDASPTRPDLYEYGNNYKIIMSQWQALYDMQKDVPDAQSNYDLKVLEDFRSKRFDESIANNPYFFNGPFTGVAVQPAAYTFIYRFMGNKSAEHPDGQLTKTVLKSFFGMTEHADGTWSGGLGQERIPDNWYKRAIGDEYTIPFFNTDLLEEATKYPKFLNVGGNTGKVNTFTGVDVNNLTGGVYNAQTLLEGNNLMCFAYQFAQQGQSDLINNLLATVAGGATIKALLALGCPQLQNVDQAMLKQFPGYRI